MSEPTTEPIVETVVQPVVEAFHDHRRVFVYAALLLLAMAIIFIGVGRHPGEPGTVTTWSAIGRFDGAVNDWVVAHRVSFVTDVAQALNVIGRGFITTPIRILIAVFLLIRKRRRALATWILTWIVAELGVTLTKLWYQRMRPPTILVETQTFSFPSGHAVATASIAVALVLVTMPAGPHRRGWELAAAAVAFLMALSRVYLSAHWFSDVVAGTLLGTGVALGSAALVTEARLVWRRRRAVEAKANT